MVIGQHPDTVGDVHQELLERRVRPVGTEISGVFSDILGSIPGSPLKPTQLARRLNLSRVTLSRLLNAIAKSDPYAVLEQVPGPESLRTIARAAGEVGVDPELVSRAEIVVDRFASVIREDFGTRGAFNAAITPQSEQLRARFESSNRYQVHMGMRQILGVEADTWLTSMMFTPSAQDPELLEVTSIHGALGMRRLRPDVQVHFTFGPPPSTTADPAFPSLGPIDLREFCTNEPAPLESHVAGGQLYHRLTHDRLGRHSMVDMLAVSSSQRGSRRYATPERPKGGAIVFPDVPVKTLIFDTVIHEDAFPSVTPELIVYNPNGRGPANPCDATRDLDRIEVPETIECLGTAEDRFEVAEVPHYKDMVARVADFAGTTLEKLRVFRVRMAYPVHGFQIVMAFEAPKKR